MAKNDVAIFDIQGDEPQDLKAALDALRRELRSHNHDGINSQELASAETDLTGVTKYFTGQSSHADENSDQAITSVGFTPKFIRIIAWFPALTTGSWSWGASHGPSVNYCMEMLIFQIGSVNNVSVQRNDKIICCDTLTSTLSAVLKSFDTDGFTLTWSGMSAGKTVYFQYECYG